MLKALEIVGFKSFADKTRLEFPRGITAVVGPNGSGKSNVVDAIKWVLGEQSVKSLRGREMADVIFNGSGARRPMNSAEVTLVLDNAGGQLPLQTPEVYITRRVYRSGEGEYLINHQPSRLRDIRDLLAGTGMGTEAYSVIEQGKVDVLLQASAKDRRMIFEEAAGISRFKARKLEALRRLERVEQNLLRLSDIVEEVDNRLKSVRAQAVKARRYREYSDRLQELRTQVGLVDYQRLSARLASEEQACQELLAERDRIEASAAESEGRLTDLDGQAAAMNEAVRSAQQQLASYRERIASAESTIEHERDRGRDLEEETSRQRRQLVALSARAGDLQQQMIEAMEAAQSAEKQHAEIAWNLAQAERALTETLARFDRAQAENQRARDAVLEQVRRVALEENEIRGLEGRLAAAQQAREKTQAKIVELEEERRSHLATAEAVRLRVAALVDEVASHRKQLEVAVAAVERCRAELAAAQGELAQLRQRHTGVAERVAVLEELEKRQEGVGAGVREVLELARADAASPLAGIHGLVADVLRARVETAGLIEIALGPVSQYVVASPSSGLRMALQAQAVRFSGRVGVAWLPDETVELPATDWSDVPGVVGRADQYVECEPRFRPLAERLLGRTWIVERLDRALELAVDGPAGTAFVTLAGEYLSADGNLVVGPQHAAGGLISRRSQLRAHHSQLVDLSTRIGQAQATINRIEQEVAEAEAQAEETERLHRQSSDLLGVERLRLEVAEKELARIDQRHAALAKEDDAATDECGAASAALAAAMGRKGQSADALAEAQARLDQAVQQVDQLQIEHRDRTQEATRVKVELAKSEERLGHHRTRLQQFEESQQERQRAIIDSRQQLADLVERVRQSHWNILRAESELAELYLAKERCTAQANRLVIEGERLQELRGKSMAESQRLRASVRKVEEGVHARQLEINQAQLERSALAERFRDDFGIDLTALDREPADLGDREAVQQEIDELRRKINHLGNVNLEALDELDQLESRYGSLSTQYTDLAAAKGSLEKIIEKINADSRRLFSETLEIVKGHFQELFRDLFGGGRADIVLEEGVDILESGIEIVARPPGKEPRSISLLSGGEKTLTCVALLLAVFRSRPSPFCVLDEVDAALDEANIDRFTKVVRDFLTWTQFIVVTHSKKTMTCANTIYGVTMQESGVSKQVAVRFEDVSDDGHIRPERLRQAEAEDETQAA